MRATMVDRADLIALRVRQRRTRTRSRAHQTSELWQSDQCPLSLIVARSSSNKIGFFNSGDEEVFRRLLKFQVSVNGLIQIGANWLAAERRQTGEDDWVLGGQPLCSA